MSQKVVDAILLVPILAKVLVRTLFAAISAPFTSISPTYTTHIANAAVRALLGEPSPSQLQLLLPPFLDSYKSYCKSKKLTPNIVPIPNTDTQGFWLGNAETAKFHLFYAHGGGYVLPAGPDHIAMLEKFIAWSNNNLAIFCVAYTLSPEAVYPVAFSQCVEGLRYVLSLPQTHPSATLLAGDSAGGALVLALISHVSSHPHPNSKAVKPLSLNENLKGAILIDPFISNDNVKYASVNLFANRDTFDKRTADRWLTAYKGSADIPDDEYITPAIAPASWWKGSKCGPILVTAGGEESLRDSIIDWVDKYREGMGGGEDVVRLVIGDRETHIYPILSPYSAEKLDELGEKVQEAAVRNYVRETLGRG